MNDERRIILAADELDLEQVLALAGKLRDRIHAIKIHNLWDLHGPSVVRQLIDAGAPHVWVDLKLHDIPNTVRHRAEAVAKAGAHMVSVHASGGVPMMKATLDLGLEVIAITVLTSLDETGVQRIYRRSPQDAAFMLALQAQDAGVRTLVCSPKEVRVLAIHSSLPGMKYYIPGIRSAGVASADQKRIDTPKGALDAGATRLVIGRQITQAPDPLAALEAIEQEILS